jgi:cytochrome c oxidase subunit I+III
MAAQHALSPASSGYAAALWLLLLLGGWLLGVVGALALHAIARAAAGRLDAARRASFDVARLFWHYAVAQTLAGIALVHAFPRLAGSP